ncbi:hypothetical protein L7F22_028437 [Adiantum nelumboides]|nr:hypothetical protein [Adiantum nelumboides]
MSPKQQEVQREDIIEEHIQEEAQRIQMEEEEQDAVEVALMDMAGEMLYRSFAHKMEHFTCAFIADSNSSSADVNRWK